MVWQKIGRAIFALIEQKRLQSDANDDAFSSCRRRFDRLKSPRAEWGSAGVWSVRNRVVSCHRFRAVVRRFAPAVLPAALALFAGCADKRAGPLPEAGFQVEFVSHNIADKMKAGEKVLADVTVKNISSATWPSEPSPNELHAVNLSYHWLTRRGRMVVFDGIRTPLPRDLAPGESVPLNVAIQPPDQPGVYRLEVTLVQEGVAWFPERGGDKLTRRVIVVAERGAGPAPTGAPHPSGGFRAKAKNRKKPGALPPEKTGSPGQTAQSVKTPASRDGQNGPWAVQVGSYTRKGDAESLAAKLRDKGYNTHVSVSEIKGKSWHQVRVGGFASRAEANKFQDELRAKEDSRQSFVVKVQ